MPKRFAEIEIHRSGDGRIKGVGCFRGNHLFEGEFRKDYIVLVRVFNQQFQGTIFLMVFDFQGT